MKTEIINNYQFTITLSGFGETPEQAWEDAVEGFVTDPGHYDPSDKCEVIGEDV